MTIKFSGNVRDKLGNPAIYGYIWLFFLWPLLSDPYEHVRDEVKPKCDVIWHQTRLYLVGSRQGVTQTSFKELGALQIKTPFHNIFCFILKKRISIWIAASGKYKKCSLLAKQIFYLCSCSQKNHSARMLANARKDHSWPLTGKCCLSATWFTKSDISMCCFTSVSRAWPPENCKYQSPARSHTFAS